MIYLHEWPSCGCQLADDDTIVFCQPCLVTIRCEELRVLADSLSIRKGRTFDIDDDSRRHEVAMRIERIENKVQRRLDRLYATA